MKKIVVNMEDYQPAEQQITVRDGRITRIELTLKRQPAVEPVRDAAESGRRESITHPQPGVPPRKLFSVSRGATRASWRMRSLRTA